MGEEMKVSASLYRAVLEDNERLRANMSLGETIPHCSDCGVLLHCEGSQREHEWEWHRRYKEAEARIEAALDEMPDALQRMPPKYKQLLHPVIAALKGEGEHGGVFNRRWHDPECECSGCEALEGEGE